MLAKIPATGKGPLPQPCSLEAALPGLQPAAWSGIASARPGATTAYLGQQLGEPTR